MKLVVTEKNDAATKIAALLGVKKPKADKVYSTPVYRFEVDGEEWVTIGLRGHILEPDFTPTLIYKKRGGWRGVTAEGEAIPAQLPASLARPPFKKKKFPSSTPNIPLIPSLSAILTGLRTPRPWQLPRFRRRPIIRFSSMGVWGLVKHT